MTIIDHRPEAMITYVNQNTKSHIVNITLKQWLQPVKTDQATQETHCKHFTNMTITLKQWLQPVKTDQATQETHGKRFTNMTTTLKKIIATYQNTSSHTVNALQTWPLTIIDHHPRQKRRDQKLMNTLTTIWPHRPFWLSAIKIYFLK